MMKRIRAILFAAILSIAVIQPFNLVSMDYVNNPVVTTVEAKTTIPKYSGKPYAILNKNMPTFTSTQKKNKSAFEKYSQLDKYGRCGVAFANICKQIMPTSPRGNISSVHPSGWKSKMGWERCHLIGYQLAGENANKKNLITGTHYFNVSGMLPFENMVADYVEETGNHVLYRVTPVFSGSNLIASGVQIEAWSVEDKGEGICFNVYVYNVQPGKNIDYKTGTVSNSSVAKNIQKISGGIYTKTYKASDVKTAAKKFSIGAKTTTGKLTYKKVSGSSKLSVSSNGVVTIKKGTSVGTYSIKVKINAAATSKYKSTSVTKTITVKVNKTSVKSSTTSKSSTVWISSSGKKYHCIDHCGTMNPAKAIKMSEKDAKKKGYTACSKCYK